MKRLTFITLLLAFIVVSFFSCCLILNYFDRITQKEYKQLINSLDSEIKELDRRARVLSNLKHGLEFVGNNKEHTSINTLHFIKEAINPNSRYRQLAANQLINAMYGTQDLYYSPDVFPVFLSIKSPHESDY